MQKFQDIEEDHLRKMKQLIKSYSQSLEDTHVQVGQVSRSLMTARLRSQVSGFVFYLQCVHVFV